MSAPFKPSDLSFIPEFFFDLIARIVPGIFVMGFAYLYLNEASTLSDGKSEFFCDILKTISENKNVPGWFWLFFLIGFAYYVSISFAMVFRIFDFDGQCETMEENIRFIININNVPAEEQPQYMRIIAEKNAAIALIMGLSIVSLLALIVTEICKSAEIIPRISFSDLPLLVVFGVTIYLLAFMVFNYLYKGQRKIVYTLLFCLLYSISAEVYFMCLCNNLTSSMLIINIISLFFVFSMYVWSKILDEILEKRLEKYRKNKEKELLKNFSVNFASLTIEENRPGESDQK